MNKLELELFQSHTMNRSGWRKRSREEAQSGGARRRAEGPPAERHPGKADSACVEGGLQTVWDPNHWGQEAGAGGRLDKPPGLVTDVI